MASFDSLSWWLEGVCQVAWVQHFRQSYSQCPGHYLPDWPDGAHLDHHHPLQAKAHQVTVQPAADSFDCVQHSAHSPPAVGQSW